MLGYAWILIVLIVVVSAVMAWPYWYRRYQELRLQRARDGFHRQREWLEARFMTLASQTGKPRGLAWANCDFEDPVAFARDRNTGQLKALVGVTITFEAIPGGGMEEVEAVGDAKAATAVFFLEGDRWQTDGRAILNLNPSETIRYFQNELETVD